MKTEPKYKLGEKLFVRTLKLTMEVIITKRCAVGDYDKEEYRFCYNFKHTADIKDPWNWTDVPEGNLESMIWEAKQHDNDNKRLV